MSPFRCGAFAVLLGTIVSLALCAAPSVSYGWKGKQTDLSFSRDPWVEQLSSSPRAFYYHNFLSEAEADHLVKLAQPYMQRSTVVGDGRGGVVNDIRTSYGTFIRRMQDDTVTAMERRLALWTHLNVSHQEDVQVLRYGIGQKYGAHYDSLINDSPRLATVLVYLADTEEGGETAFPQNSEWIDPGLPDRMGPFSSCARGHVAARPRKGDAMLFFSLRPDGSVDPAALHTGCPVVRGVKWTATIWIHTEPFRPHLLEKDNGDDPEPLPDDCRDLHERCGDWASTGECKSNPHYMLGWAGTVGACRLACEACRQCEPTDYACRSENREKGGYLPLNLETGEII